MLSLKVLVKKFCILNTPFTVLLLFLCCDHLFESSLNRWSHYDLGEILEHLWKSQMCKFNFNHTTSAISWPNHMFDHLLELSLWEKVVKDKTGQEIAITEMKICTLSGTLPFMYFSAEEAVRLVPGSCRKKVERMSYVCSYCDQPFGDKTDLNRHIRTHTGERPYMCEHCGRAFGRKYGLNNHIRLKHGMK